MFREKYKNANRCIDSTTAYERVKMKLEKEKRLKMVWQRAASMAACLVICVAGLSVYEIKKSSNSEIENNLIAPASETGKMVRVYEPEEDSIIQEPVASDMSVTEESIENYEVIINEGFYQKREVNDTVILEKSDGKMYECWIKKDGKVIKISATDVSQTEREKILNSILN